MKTKFEKNILIIGASLYGCLLAYQYSKNKNVKVHLVDGSSKLLNSLNFIKINNIKINNGFHAIEIPRASSLVDFLKNKLKLKLSVNEKIQKLLIGRSIIDFKDGYSKWPKKLQKDLKKKFIIKKKDKLKNFYSNKLLKLVNACSSRFNNKSNEYSHLFIPWFLPKEYRILSKDEGDVFRQKARDNKILFKYAVPNNRLFSSLQKKFYYFLKSKGVKISLNTSFEFDKKNFKLRNNSNDLNIKNKNINKIFFCAPLAFLLKSIDIDHLKKLKKHKRNLINVLLEIDNNEKFTEMICLNHNLKSLNRISLLKKNTFDKKSILQLEIIQNKETLNSIDIKKIKNEIEKIFNLKNKPIFLGYKNSRSMFFPDQKWNLKSTKIIENWKNNFKTKIHMRYSFGPINMAKAWMYSIKDAKIGI